MITVKKKERKHALGQESKIQEKMITTKKREESKWKTQIRIRIRKKEDKQGLFS